MLKFIAPVALALSISGCISLEGITTAAFDNYKSTSDKKFSTFICENGYKTLINYQRDDYVIVSFKDGKNTYVVDTYRQNNDQNTPYISQTQTVKWLEHGDGTATLTYPDSNWRDTKKVWETACRPR